MLIVGRHAERKAVAAEVDPGTHCKHMFLSIMLLVCYGLRLLFFRAHTPRACAAPSPIGPAPRVEESQIAFEVWVGGWGGYLCDNRITQYDGIISKIALQFRTVPEFDQKLHCDACNFA